MSEALLTRITEDNHGALEIATSRRSPPLMRGKLAVIVMIPGLVMASACPAADSKGERVDAPRGTERRGDQDPSDGRKMAGSHPLVKSVDEGVLGTLLLGLGSDEARLLYPMLAHNAASADELGGLLPEQLAQHRRVSLSAGLFQGDADVWTGARATYEGPGGVVEVMVQDTGWEPTQLNPLLRAWAASTEEPLAPGRPVAAKPAAAGGTILHAPAVSAAQPRLVLHAWSAEADATTLRAIVAAVPVEAAAALIGRAVGTGAWAASDRLPTGDAVASLARPALLAEALPPAPEGWTVAAEGWGYHITGVRTVVATAARMYLGPDGVALAQAMDLGDPQKPVLVDLGEAAAKMTDPLGESDGKAPDRKGVRCSDEFASCKWVDVAADRIVLTASAPRAVGPDGLEALGATFDRAKAASALP